MWKPFTCLPQSVLVHFTIFPRSWLGLETQKQGNWLKIKQARTITHAYNTHTNAIHKRFCLSWDIYQSIIIILQQSGTVGACRANNPEAVGSKLTFASSLRCLPFEIYIFFSSGFFSLALSDLDILVWATTFYNTDNSIIKMCWKPGYQHSTKLMILLNESVLKAGISIIVPFTCKPRALPSES